MKVECTDLMDPRLVCVSTINRVVNREGNHLQFVGGFGGFYTLGDLW